MDAKHITDLDRLNRLIAESGITLTALANKCGIKRSTLYNRLKGRGYFYDYEIDRLSKVLGMTNPMRDRIFFAKNVGKKET